MKTVIETTAGGSRHWVGDGFPVTSLFSYQHHAESMSPFLLLDYAGPADFQPAGSPRGVGPHPHRGFETVTMVYQGEVAHRDTAGNGGEIGPGDVQWMTAGAGILHEEYHSGRFTQSGGVLEMVQLWVNLPARYKQAAPAYQALLAREIPTAELPDGAGSLRVIAGEHDGHIGPARTFTPMHVWDIRLKAGRRATLNLPEGWGAGVVTLRGPVLINDSTLTRDAGLAVLDRSGNRVTLEANADAMLLLLSGEPIDEPVVGHGPFVMNTTAEIHQAISDYRSGRFGQIEG
ncbi:MAG: pirin family protein [Chromatiales bacterium]|nr:pirin family protein [Chromatiales bacterium]